MRSSTCLFKEIAISLQASLFNYFYYGGSYELQITGFFLILKDKFKRLFVSPHHERPHDTNSIKAVQTSTVRAFVFGLKSHNRWIGASADSSFACNARSAVHTQNSLFYNIQLSITHLTRLYNDSNDR